MKMRKVFICSPFRADSLAQEQANLEYARQLCLYAIKEGYAPFAPHLLYPQFLSETPENRELGINAGKEFMKACDEFWFGVKHGLSEGMADEIQDAASVLQMPVFCVVSDIKSEHGFSRSQTEKLPES